MRKFSKEQSAEKARRHDEIANSWCALDSAIVYFNEKMREAFQKVQSASTRYVDAVNAANEWRDNLHCAASDYFGDKSEKWQESDTGSQYSAWVDALGTEIDTPDEVSEPEELECPEDVSDALNDLPEDPGAA